MDQRKHTVIHEAGHAVACNELGIMNDSLSIIPNVEEGSAGGIAVEDSEEVFFVPPGTDPFSPENQAALQAWAENHAIIDYAGHAAVVVLLGMGDMSDRSAMRHGAYSDFENARKRLGNDQERMQSGKDLAVAIISARHADVVSLAEAALKHGQLDGQEVEVLLQHAQGLISQEELQTLFPHLLDKPSPRD